VRVYVSSILSITTVLESRQLAASRGRNAALSVAVIFVALAVIASSVPRVVKHTAATNVSAGDTAWIITASAMVLLMTPGVAFFYGGLVNSQNVVTTMYQSFIAMGVISVLWTIIGFSLAFGESGGGIIGNPSTYFMCKYGSHLIPLINMYLQTIVLALRHRILLPVFHCLYLACFS
jgi:hypothetical protein